MLRIELVKDSEGFFIRHISDENGVEYLQGNGEYKDNIFYFANAEIAKEIYAEFTNVQTSLPAETIVDCIDATGFWLSESNEYITGGLPWGYNSPVHAGGNESVIDKNRQALTGFNRYKGKKGTVEFDNYDFYLGGKDNVVFDNSSNSNDTSLDFSTDI